MALLDRNGFYGSPRFHMTAKKSGICAHVGTELTVTDESGVASYPLLCESQLGYQNLCRLITRTRLRVPEAKLIEAAALCGWRTKSFELFRDVVVLMRETGMRNERELYRVRVESIDWIIS